MAHKDNKGTRAAGLVDSLTIAIDAYGDTEEMYRQEAILFWAQQLAEVRTGLTRARTAIQGGNFGIGYDCLHILCSERFRDVIGDDADLLFDLASSALVLRDKALAL